MGVGRQTVFECSRINEGLEARAWLSPCLRDMVELVVGKVKAAHQRSNGPGLWGHGDQAAFHLGQLRDFPRATGQSNNPNDRSFADSYG